MRVAVLIVGAVLAPSALAAAPGVARHESPAPVGVGAAASYAVRVASANLMGVTVTNYGFVGNNFVNRSPSMEYPLGTGYEHLVNGGLWIGARSVDGGGAFTGVTTACRDLSQGGATATATEYTPSGDQIAVRSNLPGSPYYDPAAVSDLDLLSEFDDLTPRRASSNP